MKKIRPKSLFFAAALSLVIFYHGSFAGIISAKEKTAFSSIPYTSPPEKRQWRIGFRANEFMDMIELPTSKAACEECDKITDETWPHEKTENLDPAKLNVIPLPYRKDGTIGSSIVNPEKWFVLDLKGNVREVSVNRLAAVFSQVSSGCCYMTTEVLGQKDSIAIDPSGPTPERLFVAFTSKPEPVPVMRRVETGQKRYILNETKIPAEYAALLDSQALKTALGENLKTFKNGLSQFYVQEFQAVLDQAKGIEKLVLTGWITDEYSCAFALYRKEEKSDSPLAVYYKSRQAYNDNFSAKVEATSDLDGNGTDELILSVTYYEGNAFKIFTLKDGQLVQLYETGYYGL